VSELKTLKDIEDYMLGQPTCDVVLGMVEPKDLREEAINWIKKYLLSLDEELLKPTEETPIYMNKNTMYWIIHFFNITDEDLK